MAEPSTTSFEQHSLRAGMGANLFMGVAGVSAAVLSNSDALMVDGLYSAVNLGSAIVAGKVALSVQRSPDRTRPFGYDADEALYVLFRSLVLLGILAFAVINSGIKIAHYLRGGEVPELIFGPIAIYAVVMFVTCLALAGFHHHNWKKTGRSSEILRAERSASLVDGFLSAGAGAALVSVPLLKGSPLAGVIPVADAVVVLVLATLMIGKPLQMLRSAVGEAAGVSAGEESVAAARQRLEALLEDIPGTLLEVAVTKMGRSHFVVAYVQPDEELRPEHLDTFREEAREAVADLFPKVVSQVFYTTRSPYHD